MNSAIAIEPAQGNAAAGRANDPEVAAMRSRIADAVRAGGGHVTTADQAAGLVWLTQDGVGELGRFLDKYPAIRWVQFPWAGVEELVAQGFMDRDVTFTCAKGLFADQVAEHALTLVLASLRHLVAQARTPRWHSIDPGSLFGRRVTILGGGGTSASLVRLLQPFQCRIRVLRRTAQPMQGVDETLPVSALEQVLPETDVLVLALALTPRTRHIIGAEQLALLPPHAVLVNVARGKHVDTEALYSALQDGSIAAAALDVTEPEPLPEGHPLWHHPGALITSHCADSADYVAAMLCGRVTRNVANLRDGLALEGLVDARHGY
ncbi:D-isomer specific 2-hydroxyacid dehydrogenase family protein [Streptomyces sp. NPDC005533]|uniref:D-isomer specific 2-hydroxyacid dehydrogenase family protein n=1 Tax=Streptomyces sp. NPDC005533 TaxID=3364723 RepID=UPI0036A1CF78